MNSRKRSKLSTKAKSEVFLVSASHAISIGQPGYIDRLLAKYDMTNAKSASTPFSHVGDQKRYALQPQIVPRTYRLSQTPLCLHKTRYRGYALHSRAACFTMPQINLQLLYCLRMFINRPDYRYHQLFRCAQIPSATRTVPLLTESQTALEISDNPAKYRQAKHIDVRYHAVRHYIHDSKIQIDYIPSAYQPADLFTKALETKHQRFCRMIGLLNSYKAIEEQNFLYYTIFMYHKRRFFSEYAALQRVSHHQFLVSIKDFSYLKQSVYLVFSFFSFFKKPWECYTGKAVHTHLLYIALYPLSLD